MEHKSMPLYQRLDSITKGVRENLESMPDFRGGFLQEYRKVLVGHSSLFEREPLGFEFDFVSYNKPNFKWTEQKHKDDLFFVAKIIFKSSINNLKIDIEQELLKFHSVQALRKLLILVNTKDERDSSIDIIPYFIKNYELLLNFPPYIHESITLEHCPVCGTAPSRIEPWFYNEETSELLPILEFMAETTYFRF